jgi:hypothetical protein
MADQDIDAAVVQLRACLAVEAEAERLFGEAKAAYEAAGDAYDRAIDQTAAARKALTIAAEMKVSP